MDPIVHRVRKKAAELYAAPNLEIPWNAWMWHDHVLVVANIAEAIAKRTSCSVDDVLIAAYLHDIAFAWTRKDEPTCDEQSMRVAREILRESGCEEGRISHIVDDIIAPHGMHDARTTCLEAKVLSTADAMAHLTTDFYLTICWHRFLFEKASFDTFKEWVYEKIERDFHRKIHFDEERKKAKERYMSLRLLFQPL